MKFRTIVITRKKIIISALAAAFAAAICVFSAIIRTSGKTIAAFKTEEEIYRDILSEGLPTEDKSEFDANDVILALTGLDFENPENIIAKYSPAFEASEQDAENNYEPADEAAEEKSPENAPETTVPSAEEPPFPSGEQIKAASGLAINNATGYNVNLDAMCAEKLNFSVDDDGPQVLVMHTHTTECYDGDQMSGETERTTDSSRNVIEVGNVICDTLEEYGIKTYHDTTYHDYPSYQNSYTRALGTISTRLNEYPSIKMVLDIHRDAFIYSDGSKLTVSCEQNGVSTAKVMLVCGSDSMGLEHKSWRENLKLAAKIQNAAEIMYPGLMRPVNLRTERFNMHMTSGSLLLEVGSNGNTLDEAKAGGRDVARAVAAVLKNQ